MPDQASAPYLDALRAYADRHPSRFHVPGHKGGPGADPGLVRAIGERALEMDIPALIEGIDSGPQPTPFEQAQALAADAWSARRTWFITGGASQCNHVACMALAHVGETVVVQRNCHSSTIDGLVLSGLRPIFVAPELDPELRIAHCVTPEALDAALSATPDAVAALVVSPTYFGAVADVAGQAEVAHAHGIPLIVDEAWGSHLAFSDELPEHALALGADVVVSSTHKVVGSLTQSAMLHLGHASEGRVDEAVIDRCVTLIESTSPSSLLTGSLDAARRHAATQGAELLGETLAALRETREAVRAIPGLDVLDERLAGAPGVHGWDPLRLAVDVRGTGLTGYDIGPALRDIDDIQMELWGENVVVALFGMGERASPRGERLVKGLEATLERLGSEPHRELEPFAPPPPWGELAMSPRRAFLGPQEVVPAEAAVGRVAAESLAAYPPGVPNVLPGERLTGPTLDYIQTALEHGGALRGASDRQLRTLRVVIEE
ncbi:MAG: aminotransferase class I/II-fold pyridoxal phosphate-dependent enzyme [Thermoleophilaceae bacterium]